MPYSVEGKLVVAISSRALFDFEDENRIFERDGEAAYIALQFARLDVPAREGVAFALVKKLLAFNTAEAQRVEVVILSKNDPVSGLRVFNSAALAGLPAGWDAGLRVTGGCVLVGFTQGLALERLVAADERVTARTYFRIKGSRILRGTRLGYIDG